MSDLARTTSYVVPYVVHVKGQNFTLKDVMVAADIYRLRIEEQIGDPLRVVKCFQAWSKERHHGIEHLNRTEAQLAREWLNAQHQADKAARQLLSSPQTLGFDFKLR
ncbi:hypothetical protein [Variovorax boronicumulans]|uniref:hypothetical protein n=1 Tax=Variovorax boronicumulans TaxID=436515 RepID=UPI000ABBD159|nr:hypothetical protein [Variovorax boronicumulans]